MTSTHPPTTQEALRSEGLLVQVRWDLECGLDVAEFVGLHGAP